MPASPWYSTGYGGSPFATPGVGAGQQPAEGPPLGMAIVTTSGASSIPVQPVATVGAFDSNLPAQSDLYAGADGDPLTGLPGAYLGSTGLGRGKVLGGGGQ
jgi:hypothetical protein